MTKYTTNDAELYKKVEAKINGFVAIKSNDSPITLDHVLIVLGGKWQISGNGFFHNTVSRSVIPAKWEFGYELVAQSPEVINFLATILLED